MDMNQYLDIFVEESREHLQQLSSSLLVLEKNNSDRDVLNEIFRVAHTLKGMAGTMGFTKMQTLTHDMEDVLDALRNDRLKVDSELVDILFKCLDALDSYVNTVAATGQEGDEAFRDVVEALSGLVKGGKPPVPQQAPQQKANSGPASEDAPGRQSGGLSVTLNEYDIDVIKKAFETEMNVFEIHVVLDKGCLLKAARAFIVFQIFEKNSDVIKSVPRVEDIEDEKFDFEFTVVVISKKTADFFIKEINSVSEIERVDVTPVLHEHLENGKASAEAAVTSEKAVHAVKAVSPDPKKPAADKNKKKEHVTGKTVRVDIERLDHLMNLVSELIIVKNTLEESSRSKAGADMESIEYLERITTSLHESVMKVRMVPVETVFNRFPRMIRDIARELDKDIELHMSGEDTELDRTVIDEIGDPLIHILRNSADHGLETREERAAANKPSPGNIYLRAYQDGNNVAIEVEDDGRGIDIGKVKRKIVEKGIETQEIAYSLSDKEAIEYLFRPSFSTADKVTDISGRGVGLDVVKTKIESLGGTVEVETEAGTGSKFTIRIPLTLAIIQALLVRISREKYAVPLGSIREIINIKPEEIHMVRKQEVILLRDSVIPVVRLDRILGVPDAVPDSEKKSLTCVIVKKGDKQSAFIVDALIGQQEIVIKSLGRALANVRFISGATILGDGNVALILDVNSLAL